MMELYVRDDRKNVKTSVMFLNRFSERLQPYLVLFKSLHKPITIMNCGRTTSIRFVTYKNKITIKARIK